MNAPAPVPSGPSPVKRFFADTPVLREAILLTLSTSRRIDRRSGWLRTLCYHHVAPGSRRALARQLAYLRGFGEFVDGDGALALVTGGIPSGGRYFLVTFDDGYADTVEHALPVLAEAQVPALAFLVASLVGAPPQPARHGTNYYVSRQDCDQWIAAGMSIGSHGHTHTRFAGLDDGAALAELVRSQELLSRIAGRAIRHFACPWGVPGRDFLVERDPALARRVGYEAFYTSTRGPALSGADPLRMPRDVIEPEWGLYQLKYFLGD